jgi:ribosomal protein L37E
MGLGSASGFPRHKKMRDAAFTPKDENNPTPIEAALVDVKNSISPASGGQAPGRLRSGMEYRCDRCRGRYQFGGGHVH